MLRRTVCILFLVVLPLLAQQGGGKDSALARLLHLYGKSEGHQHESPTTVILKCGLGTLMQVREHYDDYPNHQQQIVSAIFSRPVKQKSIVTPSGKFRIHYDTTGTEVPGYDIALLVAAVDSAYRYEVEFLGYPSPPEDLGGGGDNLYDIYIAKLNGYGVTTPEDPVPGFPGRVTSFMTIDDNFMGSGYATTGINAARVTVAHELHHAIQLGAYIERYLGDGWFYELSSTAMEEFVFDTVNDYYAYIDNYFRNTGRCFSRSDIYQGDGYDLAVWNIFLQKRLGHDVLKRQWELMPGQRAIEAIRNSIAGAASSFHDEFSLFGAWNYFTGYRTIPGKYYKEAAAYPLVSPLMRSSVNGSEISINAYPLSQNMLVFSGNGTDTAAVIVTNCMTNEASDPNKMFQVKIALRDYASEGSLRLSGAYYLDFKTAQPMSWRLPAILNGVLIPAAEPVPEPISYTYPSPFSYRKHGNQQITIPISPQLQGDAEFVVYSVAMQPLYSRAFTLDGIGRRAVFWNGLGEEKEKLPTGVYIYVIKAGDTVEKGKITIIND